MLPAKKKLNYPQMSIESNQLTLWKEIIIQKEQDEEIKIPKQNTVQNSSDGRVVRVSASGAVGLGLIPS